ncbi:MAG: sigma-54 dependent transcriptional regulator [Pseudomonadota bacterium]
MSESVRVAIVDDEADMRASITQWMELCGFEPQSFASADAALEALSSDFPGVVITDVRMPGTDGLAFLAALQKRDTELPVILITGHGDVAMAVEAMRAGAYDFVEKPFDPERLSDLVTRAAAARRLVIDNRLLRRGLTDGTALTRRISGRSEPVIALREAILAYAATDAPLLIDGERGSGRSLVARALHASGPRPETPFIAINAAAETAERLEVQLFRPDRFGNPALLAGNRGVVCLEELASLPHRLQSMLLDTLRDGTLPDGTPLGARVIAIATEHHAEDVAAGRILPPLAEIFGALRLIVPPLRACGGDILDLFERHAARFAEAYECARPALNAGDASALLTHPWPGNHRQLVNTAERFILRNRQGDTPLSAVLDPAARPHSQSAPQGLRDQVDAFEKLMIEEALRRHKGAIGAAIEDLAIPRRTLNEKMAKHGISRADFV